MYFLVLPWPPLFSWLTFSPGLPLHILLPSIILSFQHLFFLSFQHLKIGQVVVGSDVPPLPLFPSYPLPEPEEPGGCPPISNPSLGQTREGGAETLRFVPLEQGLSPHFKSKPHIDLENRISRFDNSFKEDAMTCSQKCRAATALAHLQRQSKWRAVL